MKHIIDFLFDILGRPSASISDISKRRSILLGYINLIAALFFLFITLFFGVVLGGAVNSDALCLSLFILGTVAALFFGFTNSVQSNLSIAGVPIPSEFMLMIPYVATIIAVSGLVGRVRAPAADGIAYTRGVK